MFWTKKKKQFILTVYSMHSGNSFQSSSFRQIENHSGVNFKIFVGKDYSLPMRYMAYIFLKLCYYKTACEFYFRDILCNIQGNFKMDLMLSRNIRFLINYKAKGYTFFLFQHLFIDLAINTFFVWTEKQFLKICIFKPVLLWSYKFYSQQFLIWIY